MQIPMKEINEYQDRMRRFGEHARLMSEDGVRPSPGHFYTVSCSFRSGDASWTENFWEVLTVNGSNAFVRIHCQHEQTLEYFFEIEDRAWFLADDAWAESSLSETV